MKQADRLEPSLQKHGESGGWPSRGTQPGPAELAWRGLALPGSGCPHTRAPPGGTLLHVCTFRRRSSRKVGWVLPRAADRTVRPSARPSRPLTTLSCLAGVYPPRSRSPQASFGRLIPHSPLCILHVTETTVSRGEDTGDATPCVSRSSDSAPQDMPFWSRKL